MGRQQENKVKRKKIYKENRKETIGKTLKNAGTKRGRHGTVAPPAHWRPWDPRPHGLES